MPHPALSTDSANRHVFVYGTLRRGGSDDITRLAPPPRWIGEAVVGGAIYDLATTPVWS